MKDKRYSLLFVVLTATSCVAMLVGNIGAFKQNAIFNWSIPGCTFIFIFTYIISDIFSEVYGYKASRLTAWLAFALNILAVLMFELTILLPAPEWFVGSEEFAMVLGNTPRMVAASLCAYIFGDWVNDIVFQKMRKRHGQGKKFALRAILSSLCGETVDSTIFTVVGFAGEWDIATMVSTILTLVTLKTSYEVVILPITTVCVKKATEYERATV